MSLLNRKPELMVLGDSLSQGCRSLSVTKKFCRESWGARIASSQDWEFISPDHPRPILFDLEKIVRRVNFIAGPFIPLAAAVSAIRSFRKNISQWEKELVQSTPNSDYPAFHNLGVAGGKIPELTHMSYTKAKRRVLEIVEVLHSDDLDSLHEHIGELHRMLNYAFVLNPQHKPNFADRSPLDWVEIRKPRRLMIQTGHNHGLWDSGFLAANTKMSYQHLKDNAGLESLADRLARLPKHIEEIHYFLLPKVSSTANLKGRGRRIDCYYEEYRPVLAPVTDTHSRNQMMKIDAAVRDTNNDIKEHFRDIFEKVSSGSSNRLKFIDTYKLMDSYDYKNTGKSSALIDVGRSKLNNRVLDGKPQGRRYRNRTPRKIVIGDGGFQSFDGMHPSGVGYAVMACEAMDTMGLVHDREKMIRQAFKDDKLLYNYPQQSELVYDIVKLIQKMSELNPKQKELKVTRNDRDCNIEQLCNLCSAWLTV